MNSYYNEILRTSRNIQHLIGLPGDGSADRRRPSWLLAKGLVLLGKRQHREQAREALDALQRYGLVFRVPSNWHRVLVVGTKAQVRVDLRWPYRIVTGENAGLVLAAEGAKERRVA